MDRYSHIYLPNKSVLAIPQERKEEEQGFRERKERYSSFLVVKSNSDLYQEGTVVLTSTNMEGHEVTTPWGDFNVIDESYIFIGYKPQNNVTEEKN